MCIVKQVHCHAKESRRNHSVADAIWVHLTDWPRTYQPLDNWSFLSYLETELTFVRNVVFFLHMLNQYWYSNLGDKDGPCYLHIVIAFKIIMGWIFWRKKPHVYTTSLPLEKEDIWHLPNAAAISLHLSYCEKTTLKRETRSQHFHWLPYS